MTDEPLPEYSAWERDERSRLIGYIFGLLDAAKSDRLELVGLEDGIAFRSPWSGEVWVIGFELAPTVEVPEWVPDSLRPKARSKASPPPDAR